MVFAHEFFVPRLGLFRLLRTKYGQYITSLGMHRRSKPRQGRRLTCDSSNFMISMVTFRSFARKTCQQSACWVESILAANIHQSVVSDREGSSNDTRR